MKIFKLFNAKDLNLVPDGSLKGIPYTAPGLTRRLTTTILLIMVILVGCKKDISNPPEPASPAETSSLGTTSGGASQFVVTSDNLKKTDSSYQFDGSLAVKSDQGQQFDIGDGNFNVALDAEGNVTSIDGTGTPKFPDVGIFKDILEKFDWTAVKSHIEYKKGSYYKATYPNKIPLDPETKYLHFKVFDENSQEKYELRSLANSMIYDFADLYINPKDPSVFFTIKLWKPTGGGEKEATGVIKKFWKKVGDDLKLIGKNLKEYAGANDLVVGISAQGLFKTPEYRLSSFGLKDTANFKALYGFDHIPAEKSNLYLGLDGIPIPETVILQLTGNTYIGSSNPYQNQDSAQQAAYTTPVLSWLTQDPASGGYMESFSGSIDPTGKGIGFILDGVLPEINKLTGKDIFGENVDLGIIKGFLQCQIPNLSGSKPGFLRFGGYVHQPVFEQLFGPEIQKYLISTAPPTPQYFCYFNVGPTLEDASFFFEAHTQMNIPYYGMTDLGGSYILFDKDGIHFNSGPGIHVGPLTFTEKIYGKISSSNYSLTGKVDNSIILKNGVVLGSKTLIATISKDSGLTVHGDVTLPFEIGEATINGQLRKDGLTLAGELKAGSKIDLGNGLTLSSAGMKFAESINPDKVQLEGNVDVPLVGSVHVKGYVHKDDFLLEGNIATGKMTFNGVAMPYTAGTISISKSKGVHFSGSFELGAGIGKTSLSGDIVSQGGKIVANLNGVMTNVLTIGGHAFNFGSGKIQAGPSGVHISGNINLYVFTQSVAGTYLGINNWSMAGNYNYNGKYFKSTIAVHVNPHAVTLSGTGTVYGALGNELYSGNMVFKPNWASKTISACYTLLGEHCIKL